MKTIGQNIAYYRKEKGITQEKLAEICNVSPQAVSKWENELSCPDVALLKTLARTFEISVDELLDDGEYPYVRFAKSEVKDKILKICVLDKTDKVKLNFPVALVELFLKDGALTKNIHIGKKSLSDLDFQQIFNLISLGVVGKLLEIRSGDDELIEVWVE